MPRSPQKQGTVKGALQVKRCERMLIPRVKFGLA